MNSKQDTDTNVCGFNLSALLPDADSSPNKIHAQFVDGLCSPPPSAKRARVQIVSPVETTFGYPVSEIKKLTRSVHLFTENADNNYILTATTIVKTYSPEETKRTPVTQSGCFWPVVDLSCVVGSFEQQKWQNHQQSPVFMTQPMYYEFQPLSSCINSVDYSPQNIIADTAEGELSLPSACRSSGTILGDEKWN